eukprot:CAMPEP_0206150624 /NCGR_PEP_ID=MMETSP1473-20131121/38397_1 /ASSEMBLY_ACC=CAM_ASM_001109 /TAXON_ID=1461547 /ORGANISM="Stichococcus sp, Strain RCC1054" /LENGTH=662 /DNA_ID=CAMNT_0053548133 /DNA_START=249 /DNA_END=2238 /DNA_ORIENTATION=-
MGKRKRDGRERVHAPATDPQSASGLIHSASKGAEDKSFHTFRRTLAVNPATDADAYHLWGRSECSQVLNLAPDMQQLARNLKQAMAAIHSARTALSAHCDVAGCSTALQSLKKVTASLDAHTRGSASTIGKLQRRAVATLVGWLQQRLAAARQWLPSASGSAAVQLSPEATVHVVVALDGAYYAAVEHFLTCGWAAPAPRQVFQATWDLQSYSTPASTLSDRQTATQPNKPPPSRQGNPERDTSALPSDVDGKCSDDLISRPSKQSRSTPQVKQAATISSAPLPAHGNSDMPSEQRFAKGAMDRAAVAAQTNGERTNGRTTHGGSTRGGSLHLPEDTAESNPLLGVMWARLQEGARLLGPCGDAPSEPKGSGSRGNGSEGGVKWAVAPCSATMRAWRDATREVHMYAFAAPNKAAVAALVARSPLLEVGAGTGYWAWVLRRAGADVVAVDVAPPGPSAAVSNNYHGRMPTFTEVTAGGVNAAARMPGRTLFLCYPPPNQPMAADCLAKYRGRCVCVVGEWGGDTGSSAFTAALQGGWRLTERVALPNWPDSAHELTVWETCISPTAFAGNPGSSNSTGSAPAVAREGATTAAPMLKLVFVQLAVRQKVCGAAAIVAQWHTAALPAARHTGVYMRKFMHYGCCVSAEDFPSEASETLSHSCFD